jgi:hypothetical protein
MGRDESDEGEGSGSMSKADVTDLVGLPFVSRSGNSGIVKLLGEHGIHMGWARNPSADDMRECREWVERKLGTSLDVTEFVAGRSGRGALKKAHAEYAKWLRTHR